VTAQVTRQESTNQLKKAVYTFDPSTCPQYIKKQEVAGTCQWVPLPGITNTYPYYLYLYYAGVSVPEITFSNLPSIQVYRKTPDSQVQSWNAMPTVMMTAWGTTWSSLGLGPSFYTLTNGFLGVLWKTEIHEQQFPQQGWETNNYCPSLEVTNIFAISNSIVVVYETPSISSSFKLDATVSPLGVSVIVPTTTGRTYAVQYTPVLPLTNSWNILFSNIVGTGGPVSVTDSNRANQRFYRALEQ
jgi:hypothetical protein